MSPPPSCATSDGDARPPPSGAAQDDAVAVSFDLDKLDDEEDSLFDGMWDSDSRDADDARPDGPAAAGPAPHRLGGRACVDA